MSEFRDVLINVISDRLPGTGDRVTNLRTGTSFIAELEEISEIELNTELGRDARESVLVHIIDRLDSADIKMNDRLKITLTGVEETLVVLRRKDGPTDPQVEFGCMKIVPGKDT